MPSLPDNARADSVPLAVDLDGTLIRTDMMWESLARLWRSSPLTTIYSLFALVRGRAYFKQQLAARVEVDPAELPYHAEFLAWLKGQKAAGRKLILATASDRQMAATVAAYIGIFDEVMASDGITNLRGANKRRALTAKFGERGYDYAGNSSVDLGVWPGTRAAIVVNARPGLAKRAARLTEVARVFG
jgi:phosphoserine phosphatase